VQLYRPQRARPARLRPGRGIASRRIARPGAQVRARRSAIAQALVAIGLHLLVARDALAKNAPASETGTRPSAPQVVEVGLWPTVVYDLDVRANTAYVVAYVWFAWGAGIDHDPSDTVEFANNVESWGMTRRKTYPAPITLPDGRHYQSLRIEGRFFQAFDLSRFPLESYTVSIAIEDDTFTASRLVYRFDREHSGLDPGLEVPGWKLAGWDAEVVNHHFASNLGDTTVGTGGADYSRVVLRIHATRPENFFYWKMLLPALIVLLATWVALLLHPLQLSSRVAMIGSALVSAVFLQQGYSANLPEVNYLVLMDKIYAVVYLLVILSLVQVVFQSAREKRHLHDDWHSAIRVDRASVVLQVVIFLATLWRFIRSTR